MHAFTTTPEKVMPLILLTSAPIIPPVPLIETDGPWSPPWFLWIPGGALIICILYVGMFSLGIRSRSARGAPTIAPMLIAIVGMFVFIGISMLVQKIDQNHHNAKVERQFEEHYAAVDRAFQALEDAYDLTLPERSEDGEHRRGLPLTETLPHLIPARSADGTETICELAYTPRTYVLTCPAPEGAE